MPTPEEYLAAAHAMARGRTHRIRPGDPVAEVEDEDLGATGAWVPIDVWVSADEVEAVLRPGRDEEEPNEAHPVRPLPRLPGRDAGRVRRALLRLRRALLRRVRRPARGRGARARPRRDPDLPVDDDAGALPRGAAVSWLPDWMRRMLPEKVRRLVALPRRERRAEVARRRRRHKRAWHTRRSTLARATARRRWARARKRGETTIR